MPDHSSIDSLSTASSAAISIFKGQYWATLAASICLLCGCNQGPARLLLPDLDPAASAELAMAEFDSDGSGSLSQSELESCPAIGTALDRFDFDGNGEVSAEEIEQRMEEWIEKKSASIPITLKVTLDGKGLGDAQVDFIPMDMMGEAGFAGSGLTEPSGMARISPNLDEAPEAYKRMKGIPPGLYSIKVSHPEQSIPAKYNEETILGVEVSYEMMENSINLDLKSR